MHSFTATTAFLTIATLVSALDPNTVPLSTRQSWCQIQSQSCPLLCLQLPGNSATTESNTCDAYTLTYSCICGNGQSPNASEYSQTLPYFICTETNNQCVTNCGNGNNACQSACRQNNLCGAQDPTRVNVSTASTSMTRTTSTAVIGATSGTAGVVYTGLGGSAAPSSTGSSGSTGSNSKTGSNSSGSLAGAAVALNLGQSYGLGVVAAGIFAGFALVL